MLGYRRDYAGPCALTTATHERCRFRRRQCARATSPTAFGTAPLPELTALENVLIKNELTHHRSTETIRSWFERLGIGDKIETLIGRMSFGQQQRVALMRALVQPFDFILADEPIATFDEHNAAEMAPLLYLEELWRMVQALLSPALARLCRWTMTENCSYKGHSFLFEQLGIAKEIGLAQAGGAYRTTNIA